MMEQSSTTNKHGCLIWFIIYIILLVSVLYWAYSSYQYQMQKGSDAIKQVPKAATGETQRADY